MLYLVCSLESEPAGLFDAVKGEQGCGGQERRIEGLEEVGDDSRHRQLLHQHFVALIRGEVESERRRRAKDVSRPRPEVAPHTQTTLLP